MTCKLKLQNKGLYLKNFLGVPVLKISPRAGQTHSRPQTKEQFMA